MQAGHDHMRLAAWMMYLSGLLHFLVPAVAGPSPEALGMIVPGAIWAGLGFCLIRTGWRWLAYAGFGLALLGMIAAVALATGAGPAPDWLGWAIFAADLSVAAALFVVLWRDAPADGPTA
ncbi:MAG: hypothetical protein QNJ44_25020 [Rhodobacter sp.]|nr:hypothetical protein [Rhodobacter sp.]